MADKLKCIKCLKDEVLFQRKKIDSETKISITTSYIYKCSNCGEELSVMCYRIKDCKDGVG